VLGGTRFGRPAARSEMCPDVAIECLVLSEVADAKQHRTGLIEDTGCWREDDVAGHYEVPRSAPVHEHVDPSRPELARGRSHDDAQGDLHSIRIQHDTSEEGIFEGFSRIGVEQHLPDDCFVFRSQRNGLPGCASRN